MEANLRKNKRSDLTIELELINHKTGEPVGTLRELSATGLSFLGKAPFQKGQVVSIRFAVPGQATMLDQIAFQARLAHKSPFYSNEVFIYGLELLALTKRQKAVVGEVFDGLSFVSDSSTFIEVVAA